MSEYYRLIRHSGNKDLFRVVEMSVAALVSGHPFHIQTDGLAAIKAALKIRLAALLQSHFLLPSSGKGSSDNWGGQGRAQFIDPLYTRIIAPPKPAIPLSRLPDEQLVTKEIKSHG
ncbi:hypothetical protein SOV_00400 [Sporomusa ovata DSM 2662]|uniref:Uncharacterized protein n=1 Tax=Sporomusa ovata TaxID=2378 RepID=A0A0U1KZV8_9FIRM|nr:hypothetical protein [Sporomusa ovata]EQB27725.1 hypothetical protein SOV_2c06320 [Sporomusa ovata DSM 2662]CQR72649.1 hypothetical protein SpAn4DRAFT_3109 [Sporomusa ovata]